MSAPVTSYKSPRNLSRQKNIIKISMMILEFGIWNSKKKRKNNRRLQQWALLIKVGLKMGLK